VVGLKPLKQQSFGAAVKRRKTQALSDFFGLQRSMSNTLVKDGSHFVWFVNLSVYYGPE
jgi:hypothetical protein